MTKNSRLFQKEKDNAIIFNLHIFPYNHPHVKQMLELKDYFITHPDKAKEYAELKLELFKQYPQDYGSYRKHKDAWMDELKSNIFSKPREEQRFV